MWISTRNFSELQARGRWKVEFFSEDSGSTKEAAYPLVRLADIVSERKESVDPQQFPDRPFTYIGLENVESLTGDLVGGTDKLGIEVKSRSKVIRPGDVIYGRLRPNLNKVLAVDAGIKNGISSGEFFVLKPDTTRVSHVFLRALLASELVQAFVANWITGAALPRLQLADLLNLELPLPPLEEQRRIETLIKECDERRRHAKRIVEQLPTALASAFLARLSSGLSLPESSGHLLDDSTKQS